MAVMKIMEDSETPAVLVKEARQTLAVLMTGASQTPRTSKA